MHFTLHYAYYLETEVGSPDTAVFQFQLPFHFQGNPWSPSINSKGGRHALAKPGTKPHPVALAVPRAVSWGPRVSYHTPESQDGGNIEDVDSLTRIMNEWPWMVRSPCHCPTYTSTTICTQDGLLGFEFFPLVLSTILHSLFSKGVWLWAVLHSFYLFIWPPCPISFQACVFSAIFKDHLFMLYYTLCQGWC